MRKSHIKKEKSLGFYLLITIMSVAILSIVLLGSLIIKNTKNNIKNSSKNTAYSLLPIAKVQTENLLDSYEQFLNLVIKNSDFEEEGLNNLKENIRMIKIAEPTIFKLYFTDDKTGKYVEADPDETETTAGDKDLRKDQWYIDAKEDPDNYHISDPYEDSYTGT